MSVRRLRTVAGALVCAGLLALGAVPAQASALPFPQVAAATGALSTSNAVAQAAANAAANGVTARISVLDRTTGAVVAETDNSGSQVASESIVKLLIAAYHITQSGGYQSTSTSLLNRLSYMLRLSDDSTASALWNANIVPTIAARYGMSSTTNATDRTGHWGAVRITAHDMTTFLYRASQDPAVGPWLIPVMAQTSPTGSDGFNQAFGLNSLSGDHGSKQGWGGDSFFTAQRNAIHSVGYTDKFFVAILETSNSYPDPMRATSTRAAQLIQASSSVPVNDGDFIVNGADNTLYRVAGGAPLYVSSFDAVAGSTNFRVLSGADFAALPQFPVDGTLLQVGGQIFVIAGGAPLYVSDYAPIGGYRPAMPVDPAAVAQAGGPGQWSHLAAVPGDGTLLRNGAEIFVVAGGAPLYVSDYAQIGGYRPAVAIDPLALNNAGIGGAWNHLRFYPADGTLLQAGGAGSAVYLVAGGGPTYVSSYAAIGGFRPAVQVDPAAIANGGAPGQWAHLLGTPADGTLLQTGPDGSDIYLVAGGAATYLSSYAVIGGPRPATRVDPMQIAFAGTGGFFNHLRFRPTDGTLVQANADVFVMAGGAPVYLSSYDAIGGYRPAARVDPAAVANGGAAAQWSHLNYVPADGTLLQVGPDGSPIYLTTAGHPAHLGSYAEIGGWRPSVRVDNAAVVHAGEPGVWSHLRG